MPQLKEQKKITNDQPASAEQYSPEESFDIEQNEEEPVGEGLGQEQQMKAPEQQPAPKKLPKSIRKKVVIPVVKDDTMVKVEKIMEEDLKDMFATLSPIAQQEFKIKGEETAFKIRELLRSSHVKVKEIFQLIIDWLKILPGINKFFLEQEAKIKTDKIILLSKKKLEQ